MIFQVVRGLLQTELPATLRRGPSSSTFMLAYLVLQSRRENESRNAFHTIRFIQVTINLVEPLVTRLDLHAVRVPLLKRSEMPFEAHK
jgi:hypothetical protein